MIPLIALVDETDMSVDDAIIDVATLSRPMRSYILKALTQKENAL